MKVKLIQNETNKRRVPNHLNGDIIELDRINKAGNFVQSSWRRCDFSNKDRIFKISDFKWIPEVKYSSSRNDLFAELWCPICNLKGEYHMVRFSGYNDNYFFDVANKESKVRKCSHCETEYDYKWTREGLDIKIK